MAALAGASSLPTTVTALLSVAILVFGVILSTKKTNIEQVTSVGALQHQQIEGLMHQVKFLSDELSKAREQLTAIHEQNLKLMQHIRESNVRIQELEGVISQQRNI